MENRDTFDGATANLLTLAAAIAVGGDENLSTWSQRATDAGVPAEWVDELLLQSVLMVGWPKALAAATVWRSVAGVPGPPADGDADYGRLSEWQTRGVETCRVVYGDNYAKLRANVSRLHPALDAWMVTEGYGRTLSRPGLDLVRRELCTVVQTAVLATHHQLHSHLRGALNAGAGSAEVDGALALAEPFLAREQWAAVQGLWSEVRKADKRAD